MNRRVFLGSVVALVVPVSAPPVYEGPHLKLTHPFPWTVIPKRLDHIEHARILNQFLNWRPRPDDYPEPLPWAIEQLKERE